MRNRFMIPDTNLEMSIILSRTIWAVTPVTMVLAVALATTTFCILLSEQAATAGLFNLNVSYVPPDLPVGPI